MSIVFVAAVAGPASASAASDAIVIRKVRMGSLLLPCGFGRFGCGWNHDSPVSALPDRAEQRFYRLRARLYGHLTTGPVLALSQAAARTATAARASHPHRREPRSRVVSGVRGPRVVAFGPVLALSQDRARTAARAVDFAHGETGAGGGRDRP